MKLVVLLLCFSIAGCGIGPWKKGRGTNVDPKDEISFDSHPHKRL